MVSGRGPRSCARARGGGHGTGFRRPHHRPLGSRGCTPCRSSSRPRPRFWRNSGRSPGGTSLRLSTAHRPVGACTASRRSGSTSPRSGGQRLLAAVASGARPGAVDRGGELSGPTRADGPDAGDGRRPRDVSACTRAGHLVHAAPTGLPRRRGGISRQPASLGRFTPHRYVLLAVGGEGLPASPRTGSPVPSPANCAMRSHSAGQM